MKLIQIGMSKSGNFWFYQILQEILKAANIERKSFVQNQPIHKIAKDWPLSFQGQADIDVMTIEPRKIFWRISQIFRMPIEDLDDYVSKCSHVWVHSFHCEKTREVLSKFDKIIYIIRDPRDAAISMSRYAFTPYQKKFFDTAQTDPKDFLNTKFIDQINQWVRHVGDYLKHIQEHPFYIVFYERFLADFENELANLCQYLGVTLDAEDLYRIQIAVNADTLKQKNPQHVRKGRFGQWKEQLSPKQKKAALKMAGPLLSLLHYPLKNDDNRLPHLPKDINITELERIMASTKRHFWMARAKRFLLKHRPFSRRADDKTSAQTQRDQRQIASDDKKARPIFKNDTMTPFRNGNTP